MHLAMAFALFMRRMVGLVPRSATRSECLIVGYFFFVAIDPG